VVLLRASRAFGDARFNEDERDPFSDELLASVAALVQDLGGDWSALSAQRDLDAWQSALDGLLAGPSRHWFDVGYQVGVARNLAGYGLPVGESEDLDSGWNDATGAIRASLGQLGLGERLDATLASLFNAMREPDAEAAAAASEQLLSVLESSAA
jgi:hypothetical protein